jgi:hypothetical protein
LLVIGKGRNHETYRLAATEIDEDSAEFNVYNMGALKLTRRTKQGFLLGLRRALGFVSEEESTEIVEEVNEEEIEPIGTLNVERNKYDHIEIDYGTLDLEETTYEGEWDLTAYSVYKLPGYKKTETE